ncbi:MAG: hypothetical protein ACRDQA_30115 [Nocardioidaceae bacterium]
MALLRLSATAGSDSVASVALARYRSTTGWAPGYPSAREGWLATATELDHRIA